MSAEVEIRFTPEFKRNVRALAKKYRHIRSDIQPVIDSLQAGNFVGDQIPRTGYTIFKVRVPLVFPNLNEQKKDKTDVF